jgi:hypothetical protein
VNVKYHVIAATTSTMSDYEDEMDVDAPVAGDSISFGGDPKKGKRSAANLPVEAEDSLPWYVTLCKQLVIADLRKGGKVSTELARRC